MEDEWTSVISGDRLVKFTYEDLPGGGAFLTAQIAGHAVVYSVVLRQADIHSIAKALNVTSTMNFRQFQTDVITTSASRRPK